jgi:hypothetical protein
MATLLQISGENSPFSQEEFTKLHPFFGAYRHKSAYWLQFE